MLIGLVLGGVLFGAAYILLSMDWATKKDVVEEEDAIETRDFTKEQLKSSPTLLLSVKGTVFDVSSNPDMYGPGGSYSMFAGHDCSVCLAKMSFEESLLSQSTQGLTASERDTLDDWFLKMQKYPVVGYLSEPLYFETLSRSELASVSQPGRQPLVVGLEGKAYDVAYGGFAHYGPGGPYHRFVGKDASKALAKMSFEQEDIDYDGRPLEDELTQAQQKTLKDWVSLFERKYPCITPKLIN